jgi:hypothetical protein
MDNKLYEKYKDARRNLDRITAERDEKLKELESSTGTFKSLMHIRDEIIAEYEIKIDDAQVKSYSARRELEESSLGKVIYGAWGDHNEYPKLYQITTMSLFFNEDYTTKSVEINISGGIAGGIGNKELSILTETIAEYFNFPIEKVRYSISAMSESLSIHFYIDEEGE